MAFAFKASLTVPAPTGSHTDFTLCLIGTDLKMATVANGGQIVNMVTRVGQTVPADLVLSSDAAGTSLYLWGWDFYDATTGQVVMWVKIPSYTAGMTIYISVGDAAVVTYQGGTQGAEFDSSTRIVYHFPDGTTLSVKDFTANSLDVTTNSGGTATSGKIDGAISMSGSSSYLTIPTTSIATNLTAEAWVNSSTLTSQNGFIWSKLTVNTQWSLFFEGGSLKMRGAGTGSDVTATSPSNSAWHHLAAVFAGTTGTLYIDGTQAATGTIVGIANAANGLIIGAYGASGGLYNYTGKIDEACLHATNRSGDWVATRYANQNNPPAIGAFTANGRLSRLTLLGVF